MALSLKDAETDRLARAIAKLTGESLTVAVRRSLAERLERERLRHGGGDVAERLPKIGADRSALPDMDLRSPDEIVGYGDDGLWR